MWMMRHGDARRPDDSVGADTGISEAGIGEHEHRHALGVGPVPVAYR
jgi:hypothetical protein